MSKFVEDIAAELIRKYAIDIAPEDIITKIEKYTTINTPAGERWMVKYDREWYLLDLG